MTITSKRLLSLYLVVITISLCSCTTTTTTKPNSSALQSKYIEESDASSQRGRLRDMAVPDLIKAGNALLADGKPEMARLYFVTAIGNEPQNALAYVGLGDIDFRRRDYQAALVNYQKASTLDSQNLEATLGQIQILRDQGKLNAVHEQLSRAMQLAPNDVRLLTELAITYNLQGQETLAAPLFKEIVTKAPDTAATFNNVGVNELSRGNYAFAIINLSKALILDGNNEKTANNLAMAFALYGQEDQALKLYSKTVGESSAWNNIGYLYMTKGRFDDAERAFRKALDTNSQFYPKAKDNLDQLNRRRQAEQQDISKEIENKPQANIQLQGR